MQEETKKRISLISLIKKQKKRFYYIALIVIILLGVFIRTRNLPLLNDKFPLALDPYYFLRMARHILEHGSVMAWDSMRYFPVGQDPSKEVMVLPFVISYLYKILKVFIPNITIELADILYPVIFFGLSIPVFYALVKKLFNKNVALLSCLLLSVLPSYLYRTMAGFSDKEPLAMFLMFATFYFYVKAFQAKKIQLKLFFGFLSGISNGLMGLSWGGVKFMLMIIALFNLVRFAFNSFKKEDLYVYSVWLMPILIMMSLFIGKYGGLKGLLTSINTALPIMVFMILLAGRLARIILKDKKVNIPINLSVIMALSIIALIAGFIFNPGLVIEKAEEVKQQFLHPMGIGRLTLTVAESRQPYFTDWWSEYKFYFYLFFVGSMLLFFTMIKNVSERKNVYKLTIGYAAFITAFIFSRRSPSSYLNGDNLISQILFFGSLLCFVLIVLGIFVYSFYRNRELYSKIRKLNRGYMFMFIWFLIMVVAARGAMRLFFVFTPATVILASFLILKLIRYSSNIKDKVYKISLYCIIFFISVPIIYSSASLSLSQARYTGPSFNRQWQDAMGWVREDTRRDAVFAHWWDYGYWVQTEGGRATITDGGNYYAYWNHLMGRHVLTAKSDKEALEYLKVHNATHLLIISDEIGKYTAYSSIGSDENFDVFSWIGTYSMNSKATRIENNLTTYFFQGGTTLDEDFVYNDKVYPAKKTYIAGFFISVDETDEDNIEIKQPKAVLYYNRERKDVPVECIYDEDEGKTMFNESGLKGCLRIMPLYINNQYQQENGALLYVSRKGLNALWTKLFLFNEESPYFKLVFDDSNRNALAYYRGRTLGPLRIWEINYPKNLTITEELREEYLSLNTPEWMNLSKKISAWDY